jgi:hypothetical protein
LLHQPGDAFGAVTLAALRQFLLEARGAVVAAMAGVDLADVFQQRRVGAGPGAGRSVPPGVVAGAGDVEGRAELGYGMVGFHGVDGLVAVLEGSERMPRLF